MGADKALVEVDGIPMAERVATVLELAGCDTVVLVGGDAEMLSGLGRRVIADLHPGRRGPVAGIHAALAGLEADAVVVVACDLPALGPATVVALERAWQAAAPPPDVVVAHSGRREPLCAMWNPRCLEALDSALRSGGDPSVLAVLDGLPVVLEAPVAPEHLRNVNTPLDLPG